MQPDRDTLLAGAQALGCPLNDAQADALLAYLGMLQRWNQVYNLTAIRDPQQMLVQHLLDSLTVIAPLNRVAGHAPLRLLDVGSGGGLPGVVIAVLRPDCQITCVDTVAKKATFIRQVAAELRLPQLVARHARVEQLTDGPYSVITARAFASLADLVKLTRPLLAPEGCWMAMKGQHPQAEIDALDTHIDVFHVEQLSVPGLDAERRLVWMRPRTAESS
jgi:16S rRNA (guanine527-N7)-methyltransferase